MGTTVVDKITKALLDEFATQNQFHKLAEDAQFERFAAHLTIGRLLANSFDTDVTHTGGGDDTGIDAVAVIVNGALVDDEDLVEEFATRNGYLDVTFVFVQADRGPSFEVQKIGSFGFGVLDFFSDKPTLKRNAAIQAASKIMNAVYARSGRLKPGNPVCKLYYVTTGVWRDDQNLEARRQSVISDLQGLKLFREVEFSPIDVERIRRLHQESTNSFSREFQFADCVAAPDIPGVSEAYIGLLPFSQFLSLIQDESGEILRSIFYENVRDWQDFNVVNSEMRSTLESPELRTRFALMNNGVTVIASSLKMTGRRCHIDNYQIVNGCQTSHVLFDQRKVLDDSVMVPLRLISTQDEDVISAVVKATNRQTEVKEEQLIALSDFPKKLEAYFQAFGNGKRLFFERRSRQYHASHGIEKTRIITPRALITSFAAMFLEEPHRTTRDYRAILEGVGSRIFAPDHRLEPYYAAALALYRLEFQFRNNLLDTGFKAARFQLLFALRMLVGGAKLPALNSHAMERYCTTLIELLWNQSEAEKAIQRAAGAVAEASNGDFRSDILRTQPFTEKLRKTCIESGAYEG